MTGPGLYSLDPEDSWKYRNPGPRWSVSLEGTVEGLLPGMLWGFLLGIFSLLLFLVIGWLVLFLLPIALLWLFSYRQKRGGGWAFFPGVAIGFALTFALPLLWYYYIAVPVGRS